MSNQIPLCWPECFSLNVTDFLDEPVESVLATQLCAWGNVFMGVPVPNNFFEVMDAASKITQSFSPDECKLRYEGIMSQRRSSKSNRNNPNLGYDDEEDDED